ncbi:MAG: CAP domain-containing protein [Aeromicrobium sp.]|uniref:CAP domain-containing protein n=1 Tax=Aeromicrobium sp. TaxID=1871063 RepID=UPI0039E44309
MRRALVAVGLVVALVAGCGGEPPAETPTEPTPVVDTPVSVLNEHREAAGARPVEHREELDTVARQLLDEVVVGRAPTQEYFSTRMDAASFPHGAYAQATGDASSTTVELTEWWIEEGRTNDRLLDDAFGYAGSADAEYGDGARAVVLVVGYRADDGTLPLASDGAAEALELTNAERARHGLPPLTLDDELNAAAQLQADHQAEILTMTHDGLGGLASRLGQAGYEALSAAENVAVGQMSIAEVVQGWIDSPGHHANIVTPEFTHMGFAVTVGSDGRAAYYAQEFGAPK